MYRPSREKVDDVRTTTLDLSDYSCVTTQYGPIVYNFLLYIIPIQYNSFMLELTRIHMLLSLLMLEQSLSVSPTFYLNFQE